MIAELAECLWQKKGGVGPLRHIWPNAPAPVCGQSLSVVHWVEVGWLEGRAGSLKAGPSKIALVRAKSVNAAQIANRACLTRDIRGVAT